MKQFPIDEFFKFMQEPIYILASKITYEEFFKKYDLKYEIWEEDGLGELVGAAIKLGEYEYFLKSAFEYEVPYTELVFYVKAGCDDPMKATENLVKMLDFTSTDIKEISEHYFDYKWKVVRVSDKGAEVTVGNFESKKVAQSTLKYILNKYDDKFYIREVFFNKSK